MSRRNRNVVLVTIDSLRYDYCTSEHMPELTTLAADGVTFDNAVAPGPSTSESMPAMFTGSYPVQRAGADTAFDERVAHIRPHLRTHRTLAERFADAGYRTAAFTPNPFTSRYFGFDSGFDHFKDFLGGSRSRLYDRLFSGVDADSGRMWFALRTAANWLAREEAFKPWEDFYDDVLAWIEGGDEPYFLWVFLMDAHHPYTAGNASRSQSRAKSHFANWRLRNRGYEPPLGDRTHEWLVTAYEDAVAHVDRFLGRLRTDLNDPLLAVTSDHGESFAEHGTYEHHGGALGNYGAQERNVYMHEQNIHVPLVVGNTDESAAIEEPVSLRALPRLFDVDTDGVTLDLDVTSPYALSRTFDASQLAVRGRDWKYVTHDDVETTYRLEGDDGREVDAPDLAAVCRDVATVHERTERERKRLAESARAIARRGRDSGTGG